MKKKKPLLKWLLIANLSLFSLLVYQWITEIPLSRTHDKQLDTQEKVDSFLNKLEKKEGIKFFKIPTGIFLTTLDMPSPNTISLSGYIWQKYDKNLPKDITKGFMFPEGVGELSIKEAYEKKLKNGVTLKGWTFKAKLKQKFKYSKYPFDHKTIWIDFLPKSRRKDVVFTPDLASYYTENFLHQIFALEEDIIIKGYHLKDTFFTYFLPRLDSNLGIPNYRIDKNYPELSYQIVLKRKATDAIIIYLLPIFFVLSLLFSLLVIITANEEKMERVKFTVSSLIGSCLSLLFIAILAHGNLRSRFLGEPLLYLEYFYLVAYFMILFVAFNAYFFSEYKNYPSAKIFRYKDNLYAKIFYWPFFLIVMNIITFIFMYK